MKWVICSEVDEPRVYHTEWSKSEREIQIPYAITYMWNLKYGTYEPIYKIDSQTQRTDLWLPKGRGVGDRRTGILGLADANYYI